MSAILQALKRSEAERHGQNIAPVDPTATIGPSRRTVWVGGGLLAIALLAGGWALGRWPAAQLPAMAQESAVGPASPLAPEAQALPATRVAGEPDAPVETPAMTASTRPLDETPSSDTRASAAQQPALAPPPATGDESARRAPPTMERQTVASEPPPPTVSVELPPPAPRQASASSGPVPTEPHQVASWLPLSAMPAGNTRDLLASMQINVHVYAAEPADRFVLVDLKRREEGDVLGDGVRIAEIIPAGVVIETAGMRYLWSSR